MIRTLSFLLAVLLIAAIAPARDLPDPSCVLVSLDDTERLLMIPDPDGNAYASFEVTVIDMWDCTTPIPNALVEVIVGGAIDEKTGLCEGGASTFGTTDENGFVRMNVRGGGCLKGRPDAVVIRVDGVEIRHYGAVVSPDYAGADNEGIPGRFDLQIDPVDLAGFAAAYRGGTGGPSCHDYDNDGGTGPRDLAVFVSAYAGGATACDP
ncbi:MAG: hypothetical protein GF346_04800 [Candidatus Eisenbacteria bacterium]|nr:hypothetical protein [Candidatus Latescibacterota bacterium]MBD3301745.1 hypothetical protein [Candidatus Eisenbacteria bacterium]